MRTHEAPSSEAVCSRHSSASPCGSSLRLVLVVLVSVCLSLWSAPASAHVSGMGVTPSDYETTVNGTMPSVPGLRLQVYEGGNWIVLTNSTRHEVTVLGYLGEPYLACGSLRVFRECRLTFALSHAGSAQEHL